VLERQTADEQAHRKADTRHCRDTIELPVIGAGRHARQAQSDREIHQAENTDSLAGEQPQGDAERHRFGQAAQAHSFDCQGLFAAAIASTIASTNMIPPADSSRKNPAVRGTRQWWLCAWQQLFLFMQHSGATTVLPIPQGKQGGAYFVPLLTRSQS